MYSCVFFGVNPSIQQFFGYYTPVTPLLCLMNGVTHNNNQKTTKQMNSQQKTQEYVKVTLL